MSILAELVEIVVGVDTHKWTHSAAVVSSVSGALLEQLTVAADVGGFRRLVAMADRYSAQRVWAIEGTSSYGAGLVRFLAGERIVEVDRPRCLRRRNGAKSDELDAIRAAREALSRPDPAQPRGRGQRAAVAVLLAARHSAVGAAAIAQRQLADMVVTAPQTLRDKLARYQGHTAVRQACRLRIQPSWDLETRSYATVIRDLARRCRQLHQEADQHEQAMRSIIASWRPDLLELLGVGTIVAATVLCAWSHPGRIRSESAFANLAGTAPLPASSGRIQRHRLNPGGDRQLNRALHIITITRLRYHPQTQQYAQRRAAEGKTPNEIRRCLKRYIARELYRLLETTT